MNKIDKEGIVDPSLPFDFYLNQLLYPKLQFQSHQMGSHYIEYFIAKVIKEGLNIYTLSVTKDIYPMIAKHYNTSEKQVESSINYAIETAWKRRVMKIKKLFSLLFVELGLPIRKLYMLYMNI